MLKAKSLIVHVQSESYIRPFFLYCLSLTASVKDATFGYLFIKFHTSIPINIVPYITFLRNVKSSLLLRVGGGGGGRGVNLN